MKPTLCCLACLVLAVGSGCCAPKKPETATTDIDPVVQKLLRLDQRDEAYRELTGHRDTPPGIVSHVVVCPQRKGPPMFLVFPEGAHPEIRHREGDSRAFGSMHLFDSHGSEYPIFANANSLTDGGLIKDMDGDGVMDVVHAWGIAPIGGAGVQVVHVIPITREQQPSLAVAYNRDPVDENWGWRVRGENAGRSALELGPKNTLTGEITPKATFRWSEKDNTYVGPDGGPDQPFMRLHDYGRDLDKFRQADS